MKAITSNPLCMWKELPWSVPFQRSFKLTGSTLHAIVSEGEHSHPDGTVGRWRHVSISRPDKIPSYDDLALAKRAFVGDDAKAIMVLPPADKHVNIHPFVLHLFAPHDGSDPLPEFSAVIPGIGRTI